MRLPDAFVTLPLAHRGLHDMAAGAPENSLRAFRAAVAGGCGVELDLQSSADGEAMVFHDDTLDRLTPGTGPVRMHGAAALGGLRLRGTEERIPTLAEALAVMAGTGLPLLVEIKRQAPEIGVGPLEARTAALLAGHDGPVAVMSFDPASVLWFRDHAPALPRGLVAEVFDVNPRQAWLAPDLRQSLTELAFFDDVGADFVSYRWQHLPRPETEALRARGVPVLCWTVKTAVDERVARLHADNVTFEGYAAEVPARVARRDPEPEAEWAPA
jgi:glycerophosphoryl diester phosphodiesterase